MAKKRKPNLHQLQKIEQAQRKNEFLRKLHEILSILTGLNVYEKIPQKYLDELYDNRNFSVRIVAAEAQDLSKDQVKIFADLLSYSLKRECFCFAKDKNQMCLHDFFTVFLSIIHLESILRNEDFLSSEAIKNELQKITQNKDLINLGLLSTANMLRATAIIFSDPLKHYYRLNLKIELLNVKGLHIQPKILLHKYNAEIAYVKINNEYRPVFRLGMAETLQTLTWLSVKPSQLNIKSSFADLPHDVYIQSHAISRLQERLDCIDYHILVFILYLTIKNNLKTCYDTSNKLMIELYFINLKVGYLPVEVTDGKIIIKTFLFITNNTTPEGAILEKYSGFQKEDKKYWGIDKLSTFMNSDIGENKEFQLFLKKSGCQSIITLYEKHRDSFKNRDQNQNLNSMLEMLNKNKDYLEKLTLS